MDAKVLPPPRARGPLMNTKLHGLLAAARWVEQQHGAGALRRVLDACSPEVREQHAFGIGINWHAASEYVDFLTAAETILGDGSGRIAEQIGEASARKNSRSTLMKVAALVTKPSFVMSRVAGLWKQFNDQGTMKLVRYTETSLELEVANVPGPAWLHCCTITGWLRQLVQPFEPKDLTVGHGECRSKGAARCTWQASWSTFKR